MKAKMCRTPATQLHLALSQRDPVVPPAEVLRPLVEALADLLLAVARYDAAGEGGDDEREGPR